jgi:uncharacterized small protein (DUF1192 family)
MPLIDEEPRPKPARPHEIGQDLSALSVAELETRIEALKAEIARLEQARASKQAQKSAADAFFRKG